MLNHHQVLAIVSGAALVALLGFWQGYLTGKSVQRDRQRKEWL